MRLWVIYTLENCELQILHLYGLMWHLDVPKVQPYEPLIVFH